MEIITCDQFKMTEDIHDEVARKIQQVRKHLKAPVMFRLNFKKEGSSKFFVEINMFYKGVEFRSATKGFKFSQVLNDSKCKLIRQINDFQKKRFAKRHQKPVVHHDLYIDEAS